MPDTIDLADVAPPEVWQTSARNVPQERMQYAIADEYASAKAGLSFFNIPNQVLVVAKSDRFVIHLNYPDGERGEKSFEHLPNRPDLRLRLGVHTKKIVEIEVDNLHRFLVVERGRLPSDDIAALAAGYPSRIQKVLTRNSRLIAGLFAAIPEPVRSRIHQTLASAQRELQSARVG